MSDGFMLNTKAECFYRYKMGAIKVQSFYTFRDACLKLNSLRK